MATVVGFLANSSQLEDLRSNQSPNIWTTDDYLTIEGWQGTQLALPGAMTDTQPIGEIAEAVVGFLAKALSGNSDFYNRILIEPGALDMGNLLSAQTRQVVVWNGFATGKLLTDFQVASGEGVSVIELETPPYMIPAYEDLTYIVSVSTNGPPVISASLSWTIAGEEYVVPVTGRRIIVFPFGPDWQNAYTESLEWRTNILRSFNGSEQRRSLRTKARRSFEYRMMAKGQGAARLENLLWGWQNRMYAMPVWSDKPRLSADRVAGDTVLNIPTATYSFSVGGLAILFVDETHYEVVEIDDITGSTLVMTRPLENDWPAGTIVHPAVIGHLPTAVPTQRYTGGVLQAAVSFQASPVENDPYTPSAVPPTSYQSLDVLTRQPNWIRPLDNTFDYKFDVIDQVTGAVQLDPTEEFPRILRRYSWLLNGREQILDFRELLCRLRGQAKTLWIPSWHLDFVVTQTIASSDSGIMVQDNGFALMVGQDGARNHLCLRTQSGVTYYREITDVAMVGSDIRLAIDANLGVNIPVSEVRALHIMMRNRLATDKVDIVWRSNEVATVETTFTSVLE